MKLSAFSKQPKLDLVLRLHGDVVVVRFDVEIWNFRFFEDISLDPFEKIVGICGEQLQALTNVSDWHEDLRAKLKSRARTLDRPHSLDLEKDCIWINILTD